MAYETSSMKFFMLVNSLFLFRCSTGTAQAVTGAQFGQGRGPIWLDNVDCAGHEEDIEECDHPAWGEHNCMHNEDAGVSCMTSGRTYAPRITCKLMHVCVLVCVCVGVCVCVLVCACVCTCVC